MGIFSTPRHWEGPFGAGISREWRYIRDKDSRVLCTVSEWGGNPGVFRVYKNGSGAYGSFTDLSVAQRKAEQAAHWWRV